jgi:tetratricopeptide (TPR) repeat protein
MYLGTLFEQAGKSEEALRAFLGAYQVDRRNIDVLLRVAGLLHGLGRSGEAARWLQGATAIEPRNAKVRYALATCYLAGGQRKEAMAEYEILGQLDTALATQLYYALGGR